jgi:hypothetical protein
MGTTHHGLCGTPSAGIVVTAVLMALAIPLYSQETEGDGA